MLAHTKCSAILQVCPRFQVPIGLASGLIAIALGCTGGSSPVLFERDQLEEQVAEALVEYFEEGSPDDEAASTRLAEYSAAEDGSLRALLEGTQVVVDCIEGACRYVAIHDDAEAASRWRGIFSMVVAGWARSGVFIESSDVSTIVYISETDIFTEIVAGNS